ncbi:MAG: tRNA (N(6)-L-threonylcarbamoyladenosine(37)-C(2))-methylthiotransferase MtaB [Acidobacteria bacterium]|nr:tRNA (N(6)-L-threonylcarbamoyladenosine(37)-C(2))-methylthiotransferase MtaB [Acidobacteriota bacterium]
MRRFFVQSFGCRATQAEGALLEQELRRHGLEAAADGRSADLIVVNTCTVTAAADEDARHWIRRLHRQNPEGRILVTGCYAQRAPRELAALPGVRWVVGNSHKSEISNIIRPDAAGTQHFALQPPASSLQPAVAQIITGDILAQTELRVAAVYAAGAERTRPNVKVQDGCNNRCSFCIIPAVRGRSRSLPLDAVMGQAEQLHAAGYREIVLSGINLGRWGRDLRPGRTLADMLGALLEHTAIERIRISSVEPLDWTDELLELAAGSRRIARHVHAPLESGSDAVLRRMRRRYRAAQYAERIQRAAELLPNAAFGADVMAGFPGESDAEFRETLALVERLPFTYLHVFTYSRREGTPADAMPGQVNGRLARERNRLLRELAARKNLEFRRRQVGRRLSVITLQDGAALSDNYLKVKLAAPAEPNRIMDVLVTGVCEDGVTARSDEL